MDPPQTVEQPLYIHQSARETEAPERVAQVRRVGRETDPADCHAGHAALVDFVGADAADCVGVWGWVAGEHLRELLGLAGEELRGGQVGWFAVGDAPEGFVGVGCGGEGDARRHVPVFGVDYELGVGPGELVEVYVGLFLCVISALGRKSMFCFKQ